ncbi:MAG: response regulator transcription factor [Clostridia bacterium]|nr:response regulator transcription factor [Clostridia bacterium]MBR6781296.1 response regulator transcription factor [Clostridia bacterium]
MSANAEKILVVDDSSDIREVIGVMLTSEGYRVTAVADGTGALQALESDPDFDLVVLDIMLPDMTGIDVCEKLRRFSSVPVLFLTALSGEDDKISAYATGGDDYIVKPFSATELRMKIASLLRRYNVYKGKENNGDEIRIQSLFIRLNDGTVMKDGVNVPLTDKEFAILKFLLENRGRAVSAEELFEGVWNAKYLNTSANSIMVHIMNLRRKIEDDPNTPKVVRTVWGRGYTVDG